jgi:hypothetical protein
MTPLHDDAGREARLIAALAQLTAAHDEPDDVARCLMCSALDELMAQWQDESAALRQELAAHVQALTRCRADLADTAAQYQALSQAHAALQERHEALTLAHLDVQMRVHDDPSA